MAKTLKVNPAAIKALVAMVELKSDLAII